MTIMYILVSTTCRNHHDNWYVLFSLHFIKDELEHRNHSNNWYCWFTFSPLRMSWSVTMLKSKHSTRLTRIWLLRADRRVRTFRNMFSTRWICSMLIGGKSNSLLQHYEWISSLRWKRKSSLKVRDYFLLMILMSGDGHFLCLVM